MASTIIYISLVLGLLSPGLCIDVKLTPDENSNSGTVLIRFNSTTAWGSICDDQWDLKDANVICRMLGYQSATAFTIESAAGRGEGQILLDEVDCIGNELDITDCSRHPGWPEGNPVQDCRADHSEDAGVVCFGSTATPTPPPPTPDPTSYPTPNCSTGTPEALLRLVGGTSAAHGRLEIRRFPNSAWGTVCDDNFGIEEATVVCNALCFGAAEAKVLYGSTEVSVGSAGQEILVDQTECTGTEVNLRSCAKAPWSVNDCTHKEDVIMTCVSLETVIAPALEPDVICHPTNQMELVFNRTWYPELLETYLDLETTPVSCAVTRSTDNSVISLRIPYGACAASVANNNTHIVYKATVVYSVPTRVGSIITRENDVLIPVYCAIVRNNSVKQVDRPVAQTARPQWNEGQFQADMFFYTDRGFTQPVPEYPFNISLGDWINVGVVLSAEDAGVRLIVPDCWATATEEPLSTPNYPLIQNKCPADDTLNLVQVNETMFGFSMQSFDFISNNSSYVYLHCRVYVCHITEGKSALCDQTCQNRRKRDLKYENKPTMEIDKGPIIVLRTDDQLIENDVSSKPILLSIADQSESRSHSSTPGLSLDSTLLFSAVTYFLGAF